MEKEKSIESILEILSKLGESDSKIEEHKYILSMLDDWKVEKTLIRLNEIFNKNLELHKQLLNKMKKLNNEFEESLDEIKEKTEIHNLINF